MMKRGLHPIVLAVGVALVTALPGISEAAFVQIAASGDSNPDSIRTGGVDLFRTALGNPDNDSILSSFPSGRREINWDGGSTTNSTTAPGPTPFTVFLNTRGALITNPSPGGTDAFVQAPPSGLATTFSNATYSTIFSAFSPLRLFSPIGSNITEVTFAIPGSNGAIPAVVTGFGAVFTDVDLPSTTSIQLFGLNNSSLGTFFVPQGTVPSGSLSFLGVIGNAGEQIARVRITTGNSALGPNDSANVDVVAMDDFLFSEPQAVPAPTSLTLFGIGILGLLGYGRRRRGLTA
jgi:hypothetical protein